MKKTITLAIVVVLALSALSACKESKVFEGTVYGTANKSPCMATVKSNKKGEVLSATLEEALVLNGVSDTDGKANNEDVEVVEVEKYGETKTYKYFKEIKVGDTIFKYNVDKKDYETSGAVFSEWIKNEKNIQTYMNAISAEDVSVMLNGTFDKTILTSDILFKSKSTTYWDGDKKTWEKHARSTTDYLVKNGFDKAKTLKIDENNTYIDADGISTGATWSSMNDYISILEDAYITSQKL